MEPLVGCLTDADSHVRERAAEALGRLGKLAVEPLISCLMDADSFAVLPDWVSKQAIVQALAKLGWQPDDEQKQVYLWIVIPNGLQLRARWEQTKRVLLADVRSGEPRKMESAVYSFISLGQEEIIVDLIRILDQQGNKEMAETYLNCGEQRLADAARAWASRHGYQVSKGSGAHHAAWGQW